MVPFSSQVNTLPNAKSQAKDKRAKDRQKYAALRCKVCRRLSRGHAGRVKSGRAVHHCIRSACRSRRCAGLCIVVVAVPAAAVNAVLVENQVHPATIAGNPKA